MRALSLWIPGEPVPQGRPVFSSKSKSARDPRRCAEYKSIVRGVALEALWDMESDQVRMPFPEGDALEVHLLFILCARRLAPGEVPRAKTTKPDLDNLAKAVLDGLSGLAYSDDALVARLEVEAWVGAADDEPGCSVMVSPFLPNRAPRSRR